MLRRGTGARRHLLNVLLIGAVMPAFSFKEKVIPARYPFNLEKFARRPGTVLIIAPHPDDDVIGAGGTMAMLAAKGMNVFSLYVTDGRCYPRGPADKEVIHTRQHEAVDALRVVRARAGIFLGFQSTMLVRGRTSAAGDAIADVITYLLPESIYLPSPLDTHPTHRAVTELTIRALRGIKEYSPGLRGYSVWGGVYGIEGLNPVDISSVIKIKRTAIRKHRSQIETKAYDEGILGRNRYEAVFLETHGPERFTHVELFLEMRELILNKRLRVDAFTKRLLKRIK